MTRQLALALPHRTALGRSDFFVSDANRAALAAIDGWRAWPDRRLALIGAEGAGKSHLAQVWVGAADAQLIPGTGIESADLPALTAAGCVAIDDADAVAGRPGAEQALFHLLNLCAAAGTCLLLTARSAPARWPVGLPDLASRLQAIPTARLDPPDDALLGAVLVKLFADRQLRVDPELIGFLLRRMERSFAAARRLVARIDAMALAEGRRPARSLVARVLDSESGNAR